jgi:hypothetical protein
MIKKESINGQRGIVISDNDAEIVYGIIETIGDKHTQYLLGAFVRITNGMIKELIAKHPYLVQPTDEKFMSLVLDTVQAQLAVFIGDLNATVHAPEFDTNASFSFLKTLVEAASARVIMDIRHSLDIHDKISVSFTA